MGISVDDEADHKVPLEGNWCSKLRTRETGLKAGFAESLVLHKQDRLRFGLGRYPSLHSSCRNLQHKHFTYVSRHQILPARGARSLGSFVLSPKLCKPNELPGCP